VVPASALAVPKEGDWLASVPAVGDGKVRILKQNKEKIYVCTKVNIYYLFCR
jgi:hypothetical protein